ncbi:MAG: formyltetrahydrofolate deformylase [Henriciella sp.]|jgi:formyltetrahydrofolate deformylase|uniref:formyltetrahydrofolate deformylase n=1 Tax=Henriciella sp. TaxID=1968823 RepID=UPI000C0D2670|nr:formyltetrahydrofolate deformylase [Henriciella sp.]MBF33170.1 formyltetrahydrofolate deformylase [Hyphomonadaceae bacterium]MAN74277.1 formyltetrahydrofolate deformylase [Henriciella sp.]MBK74983.1 formyltetrahydrofolate deformylase [Henriciella sp.]MBK76009.1 formyltetrahydrofolate deformylase [Henriciella sp.]PHR82928.1 MAG: formyltetrahydrofolate deformylase [Henriciella sp.]|tara:strand:+ start:21577 stop:22431 length:855 start_codon:yes stop_codon:yes gene_type:complete
MPQQRYILRAAAPDAIGILADIAGFLAAAGLNVVESQDFGDSETRRFFVWVEFETPDDFSREGFEAGFGTLAQKRQIDWTLRRKADQPRALIMVSKGDHCLNDLLYRHRRGQLGAEVSAVVSNHEDARWLAERHELDFHHVPVTPETKQEAEARLLGLVEATQSDFVVLARYMQVLSDDLSRALEGRCINIHHSFLPSFKGARPYHQAHRRGVKLIGASAHYVTADLDEGPIIAQDVSPVDHRMTPQRMAEIGRDIEARVLSRAVTAHAEGRVFLNGLRTVVFE